MGARMASAAEHGPPKLEPRISELLEWLAPGDEVDCTRLLALADMGRRMGPGRDTIRLLDSAPACPSTGRTTWIRGDAAYEAGSYDQALALLESAVALDDEVPDHAGVRLALVRKRTGDRTGAMDLLGGIAAEAGPADPLRARALALLGYLQSEGGAHQQGLETLSEAIDIAAVGDCARAEVEARVNRAMIREAIGDGTAALVDLRKARSLAASEGLIKWSATVEGATSRFWARRGAWRVANEHAQLALDLFRLAENPKGMVRTADAVVRGRLQGGTAPNAADRERLSLAEQTLSRLDYPKGEILLTALRGQLAIADGETDQGIELLARALDHSAALGLEDERAGWTSDLCEASLAVGRCESTAGFVAVVSDRDAVDVMSDIRTERCLQRCAQPDRPSDLSTQLSWVGKLESAFQTHGDPSDTPSLEASTGYRAREIYVDAVRTALDARGSELDATSLAFALADLAKVRTSRAWDAGEVVSTPEEGRPLSVARAALAGRGVDQVGAALRRGEAFVLLHQDESGWVVFGVHTETAETQVQVDEIQAGPGISDDIVASTQKHSEHCARRWGSSRAGLDNCLASRPAPPAEARALAKAIRAAGRRTVIVSTSPELEAVPLETLPLAGGGVLGDVAELVYVPSAAHFVQSRANEQRTVQASAPLLLADPNPCPAGADVAHCPLLLDRLDETFRTAGRIQEALGRDTPVLTGDDATEEAFLQGLETSTGIVFVGAHGLLPSDGAVGVQEPALVLAPAGQDDGLLTRDEIGSTSTNAAVVVLAACNGSGSHHTAGSASPKYLGVAGGFLEAGARQVLVSHWSVDEAATSLLSEGFVRRLETGMAPGRALARARRELRRDPAFSEPYYWGAFTLLGAP